MFHDKKISESLRSITRRFPKQIHKKGNNKKKENFWSEKN